MKKLFFSLSLLLALNTFAAPRAMKEFHQATDSEVQQNRGCFEELERLGCPRQDDSPKEFRECLSQLHGKLDEQCKQMMLNLYGSK